MKLTEEQKKLLASLLRKNKSEQGLSDSEKATMEAMKGVASLEKIELDDSFLEKYGSEDASITDEDLKRLISEEVSKSIKENGADTKSIVDAVIKAMGEKKDGSIDESLISTAVTKALSEQKITITDEQMKHISEALNKNKGLTNDQIDEKIKKGIEEGLKNFRKDSTVMFPGDNSKGFSAPISGRHGNLTVAKKQLLNICLQGMTDDALAINKSVRPKNMDDGISEEILTQAKSFGERFLDGFMSGRKEAMVTVDGHIFPADLSSTLQYRLYLDSQLAAALAPNEIQMPTNPYTLPIGTTRVKFRKGKEAPGTTTSDKKGFSDVTLKAEKLIGIAEYSYEYGEDAIIPVLNVLMDDMAAGATESWEDAIINGDKSATHMDADVSGDDDSRTLINGLRKLTLAQAAKTTVDLSVGGYSVKNILKAKTLMGKYGMKVSDLLLTVSTTGLNTLLGLTETLTVDKAGASAARILTGQVPSIFGIPIIVSEAIRPSSASGKITSTAADNTKDSFLLIYRPSMYVGTRRGFMVETEQDKRRQVNYIIASFRRDFQLKESLAEAPSAVYAYNIGD